MQLKWYEEKTERRQCSSARFAKVKARKADCYATVQMLPLDCYATVHMLPLGHEQTMASEKMTKLQNK